MDHTLVTTIIIGFFAFFVMTLMSIVGWFIVRWAKTLDSTMQANTNALTDLTQKLALMMRDIEIHDAAIQHLQTRICGHPECPYFDPDRTPVPSTMRTRLSDEVNGG